MTHKIFLSPPYHRWNPCAIEGCDETTHNNKYLDILQKYLEFNGFEIMRGARRTPKSSEDGTRLMYKAVEDSNRWGAELHYISHTNAYNGSVKGYRPMYYTDSAKGYKLCKILCEHRKGIYKHNISPRSNNVLYELKETKCPAIYEEHVFHDNIEDAQYFHDNMYLIAQETCKGICEYFKVKYKEPFNYTADDSLRALQISVGKLKNNDMYQWRYDLDGDGKISASDALLILQRAVGK